MPFFILKAYSLCTKFKVLNTTNLDICDNWIQMNGISQIQSTKTLIQPQCIIGQNASKNYPIMKNNSSISSNNFKSFESDITIVSLVIFV